jgi:hypothetical protein
MTEGEEHEYERRGAARRHEVERLDLRARWISHARLIVFLAAVSTLWLAYGPHTLPSWSPLPPIALFAVLAALHDRVLRGATRARMALAYYERGLARIGDAWPGTGDPGTDLLPEDHDFAADLDLFGPGSLFERLSTARTAGGRQRLADWLCEPATPESLPARQAAVRVLSERINLREDLASIGGEISDRLNAATILRWASTGDAQPASRTGRTWLRLLLAVLSAGTIGGIASWTLGYGPLPLAGALVIQSVAAIALRRRSQDANTGLDRNTQALALIASLLERLEAEPFEDEGTESVLQGIRQRLISGEHAASREIKRLRRLGDLRDAMRNQFFIPLGAVLLWGTQCALAGEAWRDRCGARIEGWLDALADLEALASLGAYTFEHPADPFPQIVSGQEGPLFDASGLGHPLLPEASCTRNDLRLDRGEPIAIVSGSNMSGKSTLLRSTGVAIVMAQAGAPVRADRMRFSALAIGASLRIVDSLQSGTSHFYAELLRLRRIAELARHDGPTSRPLLFLLDEVLHGTNSHDRRIGAEAIVRDLLVRGALGLVTTHDLALAKIGDELAPRVRNVHFEDRLEAGRLAFDYRLRTGVVTRSNAIELMREVGLDV